MKKAMHRGARHDAFWGRAKEEGAFSFCQELANTNWITIRMFEN